MDPTTAETTTLGASDTREPQMPSADSRRTRRRAYAVGWLVAAVTAVGGGVVVLLNDGQDKAETGPTTLPAPVTSSPAPSSTVSVPPKAEDTAAEQAKARYLDYLRVTDRVAQGGYTDLASYDTVAVDPETGVLRLGARQQAKTRTTGATEVVSLTVQSVNLDPPREYPSVRLLACLDVSQINTVNAAGKSLVPANRPDRLRSEAVVQNIPAGAFTDDRKPGWYVAELVQRGEPC